MGFFIALQFLTRIPLPGKHFEEKELGRAMAFFPLAGLFLGGATALVYFLSSLYLAAPVGDFLAILTLILLTGNMHVDGLMDTADGLFSGRPREKILEIMRDSRSGAHGAVAGFLDLLARYVFLGQIAPEAKIFALLVTPAWGRWAQVYGAARYPYARADGGLGSISRYVGRREITLASLTVLAATLLLLGPQGSVLAVAALAGAVAAGTAVFARYIAGKINGMTGDTLGALGEGAEVLALFCLQAIF